MPKSEILNPKSEISTVLLAVTGMSPAVLTETIWALAHEPEPVIVERVVAITTSAGKREIERQLFEPLERFGGQTAWETLRATLAQRGHNLEGRLRFGRTSDDIRVMTGLDRGTGCSVELADIRNPEDNEAAANFLLEQVRGLVENPDLRLIASLAGGRKTMGALLYACLTLIGRETDRLTHVLVSDPFETLREFYFPGQPGGPLPKSEIRNQKSEISHPPSHALVELADVPFVPLRNLFKRELGKTAGGFSALVNSCRDNLRTLAAERLRLSIEQAQPRIDLNGRSLKLAPREQVVLLFLAGRAKRGEPPHGAYAEAMDDLNAFREELRAQAAKNNFGDWRHNSSLAGQYDEQDLRRALSSLRTKLKRLGADGAALAAALPEHGRFGLDLPGELIHLK